MHSFLPPCVNFKVINRVVSPGFISNPSCDISRNQWAESSVKKQIHRSRQRKLHLLTRHRYRLRHENILYVVIIPGDYTLWQDLIKSGTLSNFLFLSTSSNAFIRKMWFLQSTFLLNSFFFSVNSIEMVKRMTTILWRNHIINYVVPLVALVNTT